jgi:hypothetical protein
MENYKITYQNGQGSIAKIGNKPMGETCLIYKLFSRFIENNNGCWIWQGKIGRGGYGVIRYKNKDWRAHRLFYYVLVGDLGGSDVVACHKCDVRTCVNPGHIWLGTREENQHDMKAKKRQAFGIKNGMAKLTVENVLEIKEQLRAGVFQKTIAAQYGVTQSSISLIQRGVTWSHIK